MSSSIWKMGALFGSEKTFLRHARAKIKSMQHISEEDKKMSAKPGKMPGISRHPSTALGFLYVH